MNKKLNSLNGLKFIAVIMIFLSHWQILLPITAPKGFGVIGVSIFIIVSGFTISLNYYNKVEKSNNTIKDGIFYTISKLKKFYPLHIITFLIWAFSFGYVGAKTTILNILLLQSYAPVNTIYFSYNSVSWYLSMSLLFYLLCFLILKTIKNFKSIISKIMLIIIIYIIQIVYTTIFMNSSLCHFFVYINPFFRILDFTIGCIWGALFMEIDKDKYRFSHTICEGFLLILLYLAWLVYDKLPSCYALGLFYSPIISVFIFLISKNRGIFSNFLGNTVFSTLGSLSFEIFMVHLLVYHISSNICYNFNIPTMLMLIFDIIITLILSILIHNFKYIINVLLKHYFKITKVPF